MIVDSGTIHSAMIMQGVLHVYISRFIHDRGIMPVMHPAWDADGGNSTSAAAKARHATAFSQKDMVRSKTMRDS